MSIQIEINFNQNLRSSACIVAHHYTETLVKNPVLVTNLLAPTITLITDTRLQPFKSVQLFLFGNANMFSSHG